MLFGGIDQSISSTGIIYLEGDEIVREELISFSIGDNYEYLHQMHDFVDMLFSTWDAEVVGIEGYSFASKGNTLTKLVELGTIIRLVAYELQPIYIFAPQNLKKFVAGKTFKKDEMRLEVYKRWGYENKSNDLVDAYAIARYTQAIYNHLKGVHQNLTAFQTQAIESWVKNKNGIWVGNEEPRTN